MQWSLIIPMMSVLNIIASYTFWNSRCMVSWSIVCQQDIKNSTLSCMSFHCFCHRVSGASVIPVLGLTCSLRRESS